MKKAVCLLLLFASPAWTAPAPEPDAKALAVKLLERPSNGVNQGHYVSRADACLMDDRPDVRAELKRLVIDRKIMLPYQATMFDDGFGVAVEALRQCRAYQRNREACGQPNYPIQCEP